MSKIHIKEMMNYVDNSNTWCTGKIPEMHIKEKATVSSQNERRTHVGAFWVIIIGQSRSQRLKQPKQLNGCFVDVHPAHRQRSDMKQSDGALSYHPWYTDVQRLDWFLISFVPKWIHVRSDWLDNRAILSGEEYSPTSLKRRYRMLYGTLYSILKDEFPRNVHTTKAFVGSEVSIRWKAKIHRDLLRFWTATETSQITWRTIRT